MTTSRPFTSRRNEHQPQTSMSPSVPLLGLALGLSAGLPLFPSGSSFLAVFSDAAGSSPLAGVWLLLGVGVPFVYGAFAFAAGVVRRPQVLAVPLLLVVVLLHAQLICMGFLAHHCGGRAVAGTALLGVGVIAAASLLHRGWLASRGGPQWTIVTLLRWGAVLIAVMAAWLRVQASTGLRVGLAIDMGLLCALGIVALLGRRAAATIPVRHGDTG